MNQIRFQVYDGSRLIHETPWTMEATKDCALNLLTNVRKRLGGNYAYRIERPGDSKVPNPVKMYRYRIKLGESLLYSKLLTESEKDEALAQIKEMYPKSEIEEQVI